MAKFTQDRMFEMLGDISKTKKPVYKQGGYIYDGGGEVVIDNVTYILYGPNWINKNTGAVVKDEYLKYRLYNAKPNESVAQNPIKPVTIVNKTRSEKIQELKNSPLLDNQKEVEILREAQRKEDLYNPQRNLEDLKRPKDGSNFVGAEYDLNKSLGFPMNKAVIAADAANQNSVVPDGVVANDQADNFRHPNAARYTAEAIANNTGNIPYLSNALGFLGANALGIGHEVSSHLITQFNPKLDTRPFMTRLQESGEDIYNNYVGAKTGASNMTPEEKTNYLLYLSNTNQLPDGTVSSLPFKKGFSNNMYFKKDENDKGQYKSSYADGGALSKFVEGGSSSCSKDEVWDQYSKKCVKVYTLANDKKFIDGVGNWAMHSNDPDKISFEYNDQIKHYLYSGKYGYDPVSGTLYPLKKEQKTVADVETKKILAKQENKATYTQSIIDAGFDPDTFGKSKGTNVITGEKIYGDKSQEDVNEINKEAINNFVTEGHKKAILNSPFNTAAFFTPSGIAAGVMQGAANLVPDTYDFGKDPSWSGAGAIAIDALMMSPTFKNLGKFLKVPKQLPGSPNVVSSVDDVVKQPWQIEEMPGLHLKSTMSNNSKGLHTTIAKDGTIDTKSALEHLKRIEGDAKYEVVLKTMQNKYGTNLENLPKRMNYNTLRKDIQDGLWDIGTGKGQQVDKYAGIDMKEFGVVKRNNKVTSLGYDADEINLSGYSFSNKNKFIGGSNAHNMPEETLGHSRNFTNPKEPEVYYSVERQSNWAQEINNTTDPLLGGKVKRTDIHERLKRNKISLEESIKEQDDLIAAGNDTWAVSQKERLQSQLKQVEETLAQNNKYIDASPQEKLVMKNMNERMLQEDVVYAASQGHAKYRMPSEESMAKIQGYTRLQKKTQLDGYKEDLEFLKTDVAFQKLSLDDTLPVNEYGTRRLSETPITKKEYLNLTNKKIKELESLGEAELNKNYYGNAETTILRSTKQSLKDAEKLFGNTPKLVTDSKGNTWYEFDIPEKFKKGNAEIRAFSNGGETNDYEKINNFQNSGGLHKFVEGGALGCPKGYYWNGTKCVKAVSKQPTYADSLFLYNNSQDLDKWMKQNKYYWKDLTKYNSNRWSDRRTSYDYLKNAHEDEIKVQSRTKPFSAYVKKIGNLIGTSDWIQGGYDDYGLPFTWRHPNIKPQEEGDMIPIGSGNGPFSYSFRYEPIAIKPSKLLTDAEIVKRYKKYGESGIEESRLKKLGLLKDNSTDSPTTRTVYIDCPPGSVSNDEKTEVITYDPDSPGNYLRTITTGCKPEKIENLQLLKPGLIDPTKYQLQGNTLNEEKLELSNEEVESEYLEEGSPDTENAMEWVDKRKYNIDWNGIQIPYRLPRFRKPGSYGDLIKPGKQRYINLPTIESRNTAYLREKEYGGLHKFVEGGNPCSYGYIFVNGECIPDQDCEDGRCEETDQIQHILDEGSYIPKKNVNMMWDVVDASEGYKSDFDGDFNRDPKNARNIWTSKGAQALSKRLGMYGPNITMAGNCMWAAGMGYQCLPETKGKLPLMPFESNDKFINAVNKGTVPFSRVAKTHDPNFASQETGMLQQGDIINFKAGHNSHAMTFSNYNDDGAPIFLDSNGQESDFGWNRGMWPQIVPNKENVAYVSRFNPEKFYEKDIKILEEKARTNPTMIEKQNGGITKFVGGGPTDCKQGEYWNGTKCVPTYGINPSFSNNALTNNVNGINTKIAETKRKGMVYQSTLDELNALNTQKEILRADEAKRKALETQERQRQQQLRTVGSDNTRVNNSIIKNNSVNFQLPYEQAQTITKAQKDAARQIVTSGDFVNYFPEQMNYYLSKENSHRQDGPLTLEELALQQIRTNPDFFQSLEEKKYQDFQKREQKTFDNMPWYMKGINTVNALASDPLTTLERGLLEWERPLAFQGLQSTDPSIVGDDARFYDRALNRDENVLNNLLNYINPFRAASSAGQNLQQGDYGDAIVDFATIIPMLKAGKYGMMGLNKLMRVSPATLLKGAGSNILANASPLVQATANESTVGNLLTLYGGYAAGAHNFPNAYDAYSKGDWKTGNKELFMGAAMGTPLALEMGAGKAFAKGVQGVKGLYNDVATGNSFMNNYVNAWKNPAAALDAESSTAMFDKIMQSDNFTNAEKALIKEYQYLNTPFVSAGAKQDQFNALIQKATLEFPNDAVITRAFTGAGDFDSAIGTAGDFKSFSLQGRPSAFSAGTSAEGKYYYANQDRIVLSGKNLKKLEGNFVKNNYEALPEGYYGDVAAEDLAVNDFSKQLSRDIASGSREIQPYDSVGDSYYGTSRLSESEIAAQADAVYAAKAKHYSNLPDHYYQNPDGKVFLENGSAVTSEEAVQMAADHNLGIKKEIDLFTNPARKEEALQSIIKQSQEKAFSANPGPVNELELFGSGFDLKTVGKFKNKHGGTDYVVQPRNIKQLKTEPKWEKPSNSQLKQEYKVEHDLKGNTYFKSEDEFMSAMKNATVEEITPELDASISYRSRTGSKEQLVGMSKGYRSWPEFRNEGTIDAIYEGLSTGKKMDMPIVLEFPDGTRRVFSGNTRMDASFQLGKNPKVLVVKVPDNGRALTSISSDASMQNAINNVDDISSGPTSNLSISDNFNDTQNFTKEILQLDDAQKRALLRDNPDKVVTKYKDIWSNDDVMADHHDLFPFTRQGQQQAFDEGTSFAKKWMFKDSDKFDELNTAYKSGNEELTQLDIKRATLENTLNREMNLYIEPEIREKAIAEFLKGDPNRQAFDIKTQNGYDSEFIKILVEQNPNDVKFTRIGNIQKQIEAANQKFGELYPDVYGNLKMINENVDPQFKNKIAQIYDKSLNQNELMPNLDVSQAEIHMGNLDDQTKLVQFGKYEPSYKNLNASDQKYIEKNLFKVEGVNRSGDSSIEGNILTLGSKPQRIEDQLFYKIVSKSDDLGKDPEYVRFVGSFMKDPLEVATTNVHEIAGHQGQKMFGNWIKKLQEYNPELKYDVPMDKNYLAKVFKEALVEPVKGVKSVDDKGVVKTFRTHDTWLSSPQELYSDLMIARYDLAKRLMKTYKIDMDLAIANIKNPVNQDYYAEWFAEHPEVVKHFKGKTSMDLKKEVIKYLPAVVIGGGYVLSQGINSDTPQNKYGGNVKTLSKFIKK